MMRRVAAAVTGASLGYAAFTWSELRKSTPELDAAAGGGARPPGPWGWSPS